MRTLKYGEYTFRYNDYLFGKVEICEEPTSEHFGHTFTVDIEALIQFVHTIKEQDRENS